MAWIGASFYFITLDNHLEPPNDPRRAQRGVGGEAWEIHGGGFFRVEKFRVAPEQLPGAAALVQVGGVHDVALRLRPLHLRLLLARDVVPDRPDRRRPAAWEAIALSVGGVVLAWLVYDGLCRAFANDEGVLAVLVFAFICAVGLGP